MRDTIPVDRTNCRGRGCRYERGANIQPEKRNQHPSSAKAESNDVEFEGFGQRPILNTTTLAVLGQAVLGLLRLHWDALKA
jgi:hypothetical protein